MLHNEVHDTPYSAINYGGEQNLIEGNLVYRCMTVLHDGAAIYLIGGKRCVVRGNVVRDVSDTGGYGSSAYYLDEGSEGCVVERNLSTRVRRPIHDHMASRNVHRDNVFHHDGDVEVSLKRSQGYVFERNVVFAGGRLTIQGPETVERWSDNVFFSGVGRVEAFPLNGGYHPATAPVPLPAGITTADPLFANAGGGDFRYNDGSPAARMSLAPLDPRRARRRPAPAVPR